MIRKGKGERKASTFYNLIECDRAARRDDSATTPDVQPCFSLRSIAAMRAIIPTAILHVGVASHKRPLVRPVCRFPQIDSDHSHSSISLIDISRRPHFTISFAVKWRRPQKAIARQTIWDMKCFAVCIVASVFESVLREPDTMGCRRRWTRLTELTATTRTSPLREDKRRCAPDQPRWICRRTICSSQFLCAISKQDFAVSQCA
jgi:hypothetical protein